MWQKLTLAAGTYTVLPVIGRFPQDTESVPCVVSFYSDKVRSCVTLHHSLQCMQSYFGHAVFCPPPSVCATLTQTACVTVRRR